MCKSKVIIALVEWEQRLAVSGVGKVVCEAVGGKAGGGKAIREGWV